MRAEAIGRHHDYRSRRHGVVELLDPSGGVSGSAILRNEMLMLAGGGGEPSLTSIAHPVFDQESRQPHD